MGGVEWGCFLLRGVGVGVWVWNSDGFLVKVREKQ